MKEDTFFSNWKASDAAANRSSNKRESARLYCGCKASNAWWMHPYSPPRIAPSLSSRIFFLSASSSSDPSMALKKRSILRCLSFSARSAFFVASAAAKAARKAIRNRGRIYLSLSEHCTGPSMRCRAPG